LAQQLEPRKSPGRGVLVGVIVVVLVAAAAGIGLAVSHSKKKTASTSTSSPPETAVPSSGQLTFTTFQSRMGLTTGVQLWDAKPAKMDTEVAGIGAAGAKWLRSALQWKDVEPTSADNDDWSRSDRIVADAQKAGVSVIFDIDGAPGWAGSAQSGEFSTDPQLFATFAGKVAARYRGKERVYEIGNEPNLTDEVPKPDPATYAAVLKATYPAIKAADPDAFVLTGGLAGSRSTKGNIPGIDFLTGMYQAGAKGFFDGIAFHPYTYPLLPTEEVNQGGRSWSMMLRVRALMVQNGDSAKQIWVTEFGAPTNGPGGVSEAQQAAILTNGFNLFKTYSWGGVISWFDYQDKGTDTSQHKDFFGVVTPTGAHKPSYAAYQAEERG
jgi:hypothetical protein